MLNLTLISRLYFYTLPTDMRKSFDSLAALVREQMQADPFDGSLFIFCSKRRDRIKLLYWDQDGYAIWMKRLEKGTYQFPSITETSPPFRASITAQQLSLILFGIDLGSAKRRPRYQRPNS